MCRQGGYHDQAVFLAKKNGEHELVVNILIEDSKRYDEALDYIWRLEPDVAYPNLMKFARVLLEHCSTDATQIFIDYYTGEYRPKKDVPAQEQPAAQGGAISAVQNLASFIPLPYRQTPGVASPAAANQQNPLSEVDQAAAEALGPRRDYDRPKPRTAFSSFVDHPSEFVIFLEACLKQENYDDDDKVDLYTTLFEIYLETANAKKGAEKEDWKAKAKALIDDKKASRWPTFFLFFFWRCRLTLCPRSLSTLPTFSCFLIYLISGTGRSWCGSSKAFDSTSFDLTPQPTIPPVLSKRYTNMARRSRSSTLPHSLTLRPARRS